MVTIKYKPYLAYSDDSEEIRMPVRVSANPELKGILIEIKIVRVIRQIGDLYYLRVVGEEFYFKPLKEVVYKDTQRFVDMTDPEDKGSLYMRLWWQIEDKFDNFTEEQHQITVLKNVNFKNKLYLILNNYSNKKLKS